MDADAKLNLVREVAEFAIARTEALEYLWLKVTAPALAQLEPEQVERLLSDLDTPLELSPPPTATQQLRQRLASDQHERIVGRLRNSIQAIRGS